MDEGVDEDNNAFSNISEEYTKKKEQQLQQNSKKRMSAQQREISKVICFAISFIFTQNLVSSMLAFHSNSASYSYFVGSNKMNRIFNFVKLSFRELLRK